jgi:phosphoenolpyruvate carboxylase
VARSTVKFPPKDRPLRKDVRDLGALVGEIIREQAGEAVFASVEDIRRAAIRQRDRGTPADLTEILAATPTGTEQEIIRAFSTWFQVVNIAERVHRIRRLRTYMRKPSATAGENGSGPLEALRAALPDADALRAFLAEMNIQPVFTAHPTEPTRRTILVKQQKLARRLVDLMNPALTPGERAGTMASIRALITSAWQTEEHPSERMQVTDELDHVLFFLTDVIYRVVPAFYESLAATLAETWGPLASGVRVPPILSFASWVGGDMDGNPNVSAGTVRLTLNRHRSAILALYRRELGELADFLSQGASRVAIDDAVRERIDDYGQRLPEASSRIPPRHRDMPYRVLAHLMAARIGATINGEPEGYAGARDLDEDLALMEASLAANKGDHAGRHAVTRLRRRLETFGFHLATLDIRQDAAVHRRVVGRGLQHENWDGLPPAERAEILRRVLAGPVPDPAGLDADDQAVIEVFETIAECRRQLGPRAFGPYIISMAANADDVLSVLLLARWGGLGTEGRVPLDVAPLFETVGDLESGPAVLDRLFSDPAYAEHVAQREGRQVVMIGYSDSNKDGGIVAARWALQQAEARLVDTARGHDVRLTLFHGRGGTISRGGSRTHTAVMAAPRGAVAGRLRVTEQGEIINAKYGLRGIALRTLEQAATSVAIASNPTRRIPDVPQAWHECMDLIARESREAYRSLVYGSETFFRYFREATPIDVIERMNIGSRPAARRPGSRIQDLRAIPWVFSWTQNRSILPGWYGMGRALEVALERYGREQLEDMFADWLFMRTLLEDVEMVLAKADMPIAERYSQLADPGVRQHFDDIRDEFDRTAGLILDLKGAEHLLDHDPTLQRAILLRNPYVDPMSLLQIDLLERWRGSGREDQGAFKALLLSVNGIAHGLQNTG